MRLAMAIGGGIGLGGLIMLAPLAAGTSAAEPGIEKPALKSEKGGRIRVHGKEVSLVYAIR